MKGRTTRTFTFLVGQSCRSALNSWAAQQPAPYTHLEPRIYKTGVGERRRRGIPVEPNAQRASSSVQERHLPPLADKQIDANRICRPDGDLDFVGGQFYIDTAPTALEERVLC